MNVRTCRRHLVHQASKSADPELDPPIVTEIKFDAGSAFALERCETAPHKVQHLRLLAKP